MRLGVAGVGRIGSLHSSILAGFDAVDELVLADVDRGRAEQVAGKLRAKTAESISALIHGDLDGLVVAAATDAHVELITAAVQAGLPVFCEKPVAPDLLQTRSVAELVQRAGARVQIGFQRRFDPGFVAAKRALQRGELGWVHHAFALTLDPAPPPAAYVASSGGLFRDCSVHDIDAIRWVTGRAVVEVYAVGANRGDAYFAELGDVDTAAGMLTLDDGTLAILAATRYHAPGYDVRLELLGSEGSVVAGLDDRTPLSSVEPGTTWPPGPPYRDFIDRFHDAYRAELAAFVDLVANGTDSPCTPADALETFRVAEALERSRLEHRPVAMAEVGG